MSRAKPNASHKHDPLDGQRMSTPAQICAQWGISSTCLAKRLRRFTGSFPARYGQGGRNIVEMVVTPELRAYFERLKKD